MLYFREQQLQQFLQQRAKEELPQQIDNYFKLQQMVKLSDEIDWGLSNCADYIDEALCDAINELENTFNVAATGKYLYETDSNRYTRSYDQIAQRVAELVAEYLHSQR